MTIPTQQIKACSNKEVCKCCYISTSIITDTNINVQPQALDIKINANTLHPSRKSV